MDTPHLAPNAVFATLGRHMLVDGFHLVMDLEKSHGSWIVDARDGRKYLDFYTFFATTPLGHNHPANRISRCRSERILSDSPSEEGCRH